MKKLVSIFIATAMIFSLSACQTKEAVPKKTEEAVAEKTTEATAQTPEPAVETTEAATVNKEVKYGIITDIGGVNDQSFNQGAWEGMKMAEKEFGAKVSYLESKTDADYSPHLETMIDNENDLIIGIGFKMGDAIKESASHYPDQQYAIVDYAYDPQIPNVTGILFKQNESSYLVGLIAGKTTKTGKIGFINGMDTPTMNTFGYGFYAGILDANPDAKISGQYADSFGDPAKGKAIANQMYADGCDIIFVAAGDTGNGVIEAAKEQNKWVIGVDRDQNSLAPDNVLTSAMKRVDSSVLDMGKRLLEGNLKGGETIVYGLENEGVGIAPTSSKNVAADVLTYVESVKAEIIAGKISVPNTLEEYNAKYSATPYIEKQKAN